LKVLFVNKSYQKGGAAIAARQIAESVAGQGVGVRFLVQEQVAESLDNVSSTCTGWTGKIKQWGLFGIERLRFLSKEKSKRLRYAFSPAYAGEDISSNGLVEECDLIHIHWFNQGYVSLSGLEKLVKLGKPIVWTLHDMWAITGGCHYAWDCSNYEKECGECPFLKISSSHDLSHQIWLKKASFYTGDNMVFVPVSEWLGQLASKSSLGQSIPVHVIYNPIDIGQLKPCDKGEARQKLGLSQDGQYILFGASRIDDQIKGLKYLVEAVKNLDRDVKVVVFGGKPKFDHAILDEFTSDIIYLGSVNKTEQVHIYSACDVTCVPSEYETFGLVAAEAMSCECPVVAFGNSGVAEIVDHLENGYLARHRSVEELAKGLQWVLNHDCLEELGRKARVKIEREFSEQKIGQQYVTLYKELLNKNE